MGKGSLLVQGTPVAPGCLGLSPVQVVRGLSPTTPVLASERGGLGGWSPGLLLQGTCIQLFPLKLRAKFKPVCKSPSRRGKLFHWYFLFIAASVTWTLCQGHIAVARVKSVKENFSAFLISVYLSSLKVTVLGDTV